MLINGLVPFWDDSITDTRFTDAVLSVNRPDRIGNVFVTDSPWEGNNCDFFSIVNDGSIYRMYYLGWDYPSTHRFYICYAESSDGIEWVKPDLGITEFNGSTHNNIIIDDNIAGAFGMIDKNPDCPSDERYKLFGVSHFTEKGNTLCNLVCYVSEDGIHFREHHTFVITKRYDNMFDSLNTVYWDSHDGKYYCWFRCTHPKPTNAEKQFEENYARAVMVMTSEDCVHWSEGVPLDYSGGDDYQTYTNCVSPYIYDDRYYIGFPTRYNERLEWNTCFERLTGRENRLKRMGNDGTIQDNTKRYGLTVTDCLFMSSRDKRHWFRFDEAALTPGPEDGFNWEYGDCYPAVGMIETPGRFSPEPELSLLCESHHWTEKPVELIRYVYRKDGFASYKAGYKPKTMLTKLFSFKGDTLKLNFRSSARGYIQISVLDAYSNAIEGYISCPHFGDTTERIIDFEKSLSELKGKEVKLRFMMSDAEIYSMRIE